MSGRSALGASLLVVLARPRLWVLALAGFLVRGGIVVLAVPIVVLPTPTGLAIVVGPALISLVLVGTSPALIALGTAVAVALLAWFMLGGLAGAAIDVTLIREACREGDADADEIGNVPVPLEARPSLVLRMFLARVVCQLPLVLAISVGAVRLVSATYSELISPGNLAVPLVIRVVSAVPDVVLAIVVTWLVGETLGAIAVRRLVLGGESIAGAVVGAVHHVVRHPLSATAVVVVPLVVTVALLAPAIAASAMAWSDARVALFSDAPIGQAAASVALFVLVWTAGLVLAGATAAWRSAAWTVAVLPAAAPAPPDVRGIPA